MRGFVDVMSDWQFPPSLLGGALLFAWVNGVFFTPVMLGGAGPAATMGPYWDVSCVGVFAGLVVLVVLERRLGQLALRRKVQWTAALLQAAGTIALFCAVGLGTASPASLALGCVGALVSGCAGAVLFVAWGDAYARCPAREAEPAVIASTFLSLLATCLFFGLSGWGAALLVALLPVGSCALVRRCGVQDGATPHGFAERPSAEAASSRWPGVAVGVYVAVLWLVLTFAKGAASAELDARSFAEAFFWPFLASTAASFACLVAYVYFARRISLLSVSRAALPLMCAALVVVMVLPRAWYPMAFALASVAATLFDTFLWIHCASLVRRGVGSATGIVGGTRAFVQAGAVAVIPPNALAHAVGYAGTAGVFACVLVVAFVVSLPGLVRDEGMTAGASGRGAGLAPEGAPPVAGGAGMSDALGELAGHFGLSARERDVLELLARGRDLPFIRDELGISRNTVGTHIKHVYQKMGVHSKQELLNLVEEAFKRQ